MYNLPETKEETHALYQLAWRKMVKAMYKGEDGNYKVKDSIRYEHWSKVERILEVHSAILRNEKAQVAVLLGKTNKRGGKERPMIKIYKGKVIAKFKSVKVAALDYAQTSNHCYSMSNFYKRIIGRVIDGIKYTYETDARPV